MTFTQADFDKIYYSKTATDQFLNMIFRPAKYPAFHAFMDAQHELWLSQATQRSKR